MNFRSHIRGFAIAAVFAAAAMLSSQANAQATATGTGTANATIAKPITISASTALDFGIIVPNGVGNGSLTVTIDTAGARTVAGNVDGALMGGTVGAATFDITGRPNATYAITLPPAAVDMVGTVNPANTMLASVGNFTESTTVLGGTLVVGATPGLGQDSFTVGADLTVPETQADDVYVGSFDVIVTYN